MVIAIRDELVGFLSFPSLASPVGTDFLQRARSFFRASFAVLLRNSVRRHPLGFVYAAEELADGVFLRYHYWPADWSMPSLEAGHEDHDHTYELSSLIIAGALRHQTFAVTESGTGPLQILNVTYDKSDSTLRPTGQRVDVRQLESRIFREGEAYRLACGVIHRATPIERPAATIALTRDGKVPHGPRVLGSVAGSNLVTFHRQELGSVEIDCYRAELLETFRE